MFCNLDQTLAFATHLVFDWPYSPNFSLAETVPFRLDHFPLSVPFRPDFVECDFLFARNCFLSYIS